MDAEKAGRAGEQHGAERVQAFAVIAVAAKRVAQESCFLLGAGQAARFRKDRLGQVAAV